jgi:hypothetical protein
MKTFADKLRELEDEVLRDDPENDELLADISALIVKYETRDISWVIGPEGKVFRVEAPRHGH